MLTLGFCHHWDACWDMRPSSNSMQSLLVKQKCNNLCAKRKCCLSKKLKWIQFESRVQERRSWMEAGMTKNKTSSSFQLLQNNQYPNKVNVQYIWHFTQTWTVIGISVKITNYIVWTETVQCVFLNGVCVKCQNNVCVWLEKLRLYLIYQYRARKLMLDIHDNRI